MCSSTSRSQNQPWVETCTVIVLSGLPCVGKTTWPKSFTCKEQSQIVGLKVEVLNIDTSAYEICDEINRDLGCLKRQTSDTTAESLKGSCREEGIFEPLTYNELWQTNSESIFEIFHKNISDAMLRDSIVVIDHVYMATESRLDVRRVIMNTSPSTVTACVYFPVKNEQAYFEKLEERNLCKPNKQISKGLIDFLKVGSSPPITDEGFSRVWCCPSVVPQL